MPCCPSARHKKQKPEDRFLVRLHSCFEWANKTEKRVLSDQLFLTRPHHKKILHREALPKLRSNDTIFCKLFCRLVRKHGLIFTGTSWPLGYIFTTSCLTLAKIYLQLHKLVVYLLRIYYDWLLVRYNFVVFFSWVAIELSQLSYKIANWAHSWFSKFEPQSLRSYQRPQVILNKHMPPKKSY